MTLASLPAVDFDVLRPHLKAAELVQGTPASRSRRHHRPGVLPAYGVVSLVIDLAAGEMLPRALASRRRLAAPE